MDDIPLAAPTEEMLEHVYSVVIQKLKEKQLVVDPEKVQKGKLVNYLGTKNFDSQVSLQKIWIQTDNLRTLNDFQKLLGDIQWVCPYLGLTNKQLQPLYDILWRDIELNSPWQLTDPARVALSLLERGIQTAALKRRDLFSPIILCILPSETQPTGVFWQGAPLLWIRPKMSPAKILSYYPASIAQLALIGLQQCIQHFGNPPQELIIPYNMKQIEVLSASVDDWAIFRCTFMGKMGNQFPKDPILQLIKDHPVVFPQITSRVPLPDAPLIFTDGSKTGCRTYLVHDSTPVTLQFPPSFPQIIELQIVIKVFELYSEYFNLISDSQYVVNSLAVLEVVEKVNF
jgi:hypothetical protein